MVEPFSLISVVNNATINILHAEQITNFGCNFIGCHEKGFTVVNLMPEYLTISNVNRKYQKDSPVFLRSVLLLRHRLAVQCVQWLQTVDAYIN